MQNKSVTDIEEGCKATPCNQSELIEPLGSTCEMIDKIIAWLETRRDKNINTTLSLLGRKVKKWNQPYVDSHTPDWYV